jgi:hypothetical protein
MGKTLFMYVSAGALALIVFLVCWFGFHAPILGLILAAIILFAVGGGLYLRG